MFILVNRFLVR